MQRVSPSGGGTRWDTAEQGETGRDTRDRSMQGETGGRGAGGGKGAWCAAKYEARGHMGDGKARPQPGKRRHDRTVQRVKVGVRMRMPSCIEVHWRACKERSRSTFMIRFNAMVFQSQCVRNVRKVNDCKGRRGGAPRQSRVEGTTRVHAVSPNSWHNSWSLHVGRPTPSRLKDRQTGCICGGYSMGC